MVPTFDYIMLAEVIDITDKELILCSKNVKYTLGLTPRVDIAMYVDLDNKFVLCDDIANKLTSYYQILYNNISDIIHAKLHQISHLNDST
ncbi:hypothetical protein SteCoe_6062 [Stentor coeruleus]|uniref:Uncharacterized protein n=1 Tax=Stentor coeruleus TaxID=5963 RepID=A0A1R2CQV1_9CILI|nr:hypothetical protein SteCoe_6062 [Stentor coeruleus]